MNPAATARDYAIFWDELASVCQWDDDDLDACPEWRAVLRDIAVENVGPEVITEALDCLTRDWCAGNVRRAFLRVLADRGGLEKWNHEREARTLYSGRKPKKLTIGGVEYYAP